MRSFITTIYYHTGSAPNGAAPIYGHNPAERPSRKKEETRDIVDFLLSSSLEYTYLFIHILVHTQIDDSYQSVYEYLVL